MRHFSFISICLYLLAIAGWDRPVFSDPKNDSDAAAKEDPTWAAYNRSLQEMAKQYSSAWIEKKSTDDDEDNGKATVTSTAATGEPAFYPLSIPMCFLFDSHVSNQKMNEKIHGMEAAYATCGISLEPHVFTIKANYPPDSDLLIRLAREACPLEKVFHARGAIQIESQFADLPKQMCHDPNAKGCSTLCSVRSVSLLVPDGGFPLGLRESMHSNCCGPLCVDRGRGEGVEAGLDLELASVGNVALSSGGNGGMSSHNNFNRISPITPAGCLALRRGANQTDWAKQNKTKAQEYYTIENDPAYQFDLMQGRSFFQPPSDKDADKDADKKIAEKTDSERLPSLEKVALPDSLSESYSENPSVEWGVRRLITVMKSKISPDPATMPISEVKKPWPSAIVSPLKRDFAKSRGARILSRAPSSVEDDGEDDRAPGTGLRRSGDPRRKSNGSHIREVEAHGDADSADDAGDSDD